MNKFWMGLRLQVSMDLSKAFSDLQHYFIKAKLCAYSFEMNVLQPVYTLTFPKGHNWRKNERTVWLHGLDLIKRSPDFTPPTYIMNNLL